MQRVVLMTGLYLGQRSQCHWQVTRTCPRPCTLWLHQLRPAQCCTAERLIQVTCIQSCYAFITSSSAHLNAAFPTISMHDNTLLLTYKHAVRGRGSSPGEACQTRFHRKQWEDPHPLWTTAPELPCTSTVITSAPGNCTHPVPRSGLKSITSVVHPKSQSNLSFLQQRIPEGLCCSGG